MTLFADSGRCWSAASTPFDVVTRTTAAMNVTVNECGNLFMLSSGSIKVVRSLGLSGSNTKEEAFLFHQLAPERPRISGNCEQRLSELEIISMKKARILDSPGMGRSRRRHRCAPVKFEFILADR